MVNNVKFKKKNKKNFSNCNLILIKEPQWDKPQL